MTELNKTTKARWQDIIKDLQREDEGFWLKHPFDDLMTERHPEIWDYLLSGDDSYDNLEDRVMGFVVYLQMEIASKAHNEAMRRVKAEINDIEDVASLRAYRHEYKTRFDAEKVAKAVYYVNGYPEATGVSVFQDFMNATNIEPTDRYYVTDDTIELEDKQVYRMIDEHMAYLQSRIDNNTDTDKQGDALNETMVGYILGLFGILDKAVQDRDDNAVLPAMREVAKLVNAMFGTTYSGGNIRKGYYMSNDQSTTQPSPKMRDDAKKLLRDIDLKTKYTID